MNRTRLFRFIRMAMAIVILMLGLTLAFRFTQAHEFLMAIIFGGAMVYYGMSRLRATAGGRE